MWPNSQFPADLVTFTEEIRNGKLHFLCSVYIVVLGKIQRGIQNPCHKSKIELFEKTVNG